MQHSRRFCSIEEWDMEERNLTLSKAYKQYVYFITLEWAVASIKSYEKAVCIAINSTA